MRELTSQELNFVSGGLSRAVGMRVDLKQAIRARISRIFLRIAERLGGKAQPVRM